MYKKVFSIALCVVVMLGVLVVPQLTVFAADEIQAGVSAQEAYDENGDVLEPDADSNESENTAVEPAEGEGQDQQTTAKEEQTAGSVAIQAAKIDLQKEVDQANGNATITITEDIVLDKTVTIPKGKTITLKDDGQKRTIDASAIDSAFDVQGTLVIAATATENLIIKGGTGADTKGNVATVSGGTFVLNDGHIIGGEPDELFWYGGCVAINSDGSMEMNGGILSDFDAPYNGYLASGVIMIRYKGDFTMTAGQILDNTAVATVYALDDTPATTDVDIKISGGEFADNESYNAGSAVQANGKGINVDISGGDFHDNVATGKGTVAALHEADITVSGGTFTNNEASYGGAVAISGNVGEECKGVISGGTFTNNKANSGGALYVNINGVEITGGTLKGNSAERWGGGIYINSKRSILIKNAIITENDAKRLGGGLWCCPTGGATIQATEGVAIFDNDTTEEPSAGADIATVKPQDGNPYLLHLSERVLGGGAVKYYNDGSVADGSLSAAVADARRYNEASSADASNISASSVESYALKAVMSGQAKASAKAAADLVITDNIALCGGGIGANGGVYTGFEPGDENPDEWQINVNKTWENVPAAEQKAVTVFLKVNGQILDSIELNAENGWKGSFTDLPNPNAFEEMTVVEGSIQNDADGNEVFREESDYKVTYDTKEDVENKTINITVTNEPIPQEPPVEEKVTPPETPNNPPADSQTTTDKVDKKLVANSPSPKTDDQAVIALAVLLAIAASAIAWGRLGVFTKK